MFLSFNLQTEGRKKDLFVIKKKFKTHVKVSLTF
jgi:hypothetical protein